MIRSIETITYFDIFYEGRIDLADLFDIEFDPEYIMQDACDASLNTVKRIFPEVKVLMCYFHVKEMLKKM